MKLSPHLTEGKFITRLNRFAALVEVRGQSTQVHLANSGRLRELLQPGVRVLLTPAATGSHRKTAYDLSLVDLAPTPDSASAEAHTLVSVDAQLPSTLVYEALQESRLPQFARYGTVVREQALEDSRIDLRLVDGAGQCYVEVKSVTLIKEGAGLFPDAPTLRGRRHVNALACAVQRGLRAAVIFVIQREDAQAFRLNDAADPAFGQTLRQAYNGGVEVYAYRCRVTAQQILISQQVPVILFPPSTKDAGPPVNAGGS